MQLELIKTAFLTLFVAIDPPGLVPIFLALTVSFTEAQKRVVARQSVIIAFFILAVALLGGQAILHTLGISIPAFQIAGGLLLFSIAVEMAFDRREKRKSNTAEASLAHDHHKSIAAFPLAIPLMAGPGAITATILQASAAKGEMPTLAGLLAVIAAIFLMCWGLFAIAGRVDRLLGVTGRVVLERLLGVLLAAMAVQIVGDGVKAFIHG